MVKSIFERKKLQKKLLRKVREGETGAANAAEELQKKGFRLSNAFDAKLLQAQREYLEKKGFPKRMKETGKKEEEARREEEKIKKMSDGQIIQSKREAFEAAIRLYKKGDLKAREMNRIGRELGLKNYQEWWEKYFQKR